MRKSNKFTGRIHRFECLENRTMLAGNVSAINYAGALVISGDNSANAILVTQIDPTTIKVTGIGTKVNGSYSPQTIPNVLGITVDMYGGADAVTLKNITIPGIGVDLGDGSDVLVMSGVHSTSSGDIEGGTGNNSISMDHCSFADGLAIRTSSGNDAVAMSRTTIYGGLLIELGDGTNTLSMLNVNVFEPQLTGSSVTPLNDEFSVPDCGAFIVGGSGIDVIIMNDVNIDCFTQIYTLGGNDSLVIANSRFGNLVTDPSTQSSNVVDPNLDDPILGDPSLNDTDVGLYIQTGTGSDTVAIASTKVYGHLFVDTSNQFTPGGALVPDSSTKDGNDSVALAKVTLLNDGTDPLENSDAGSLFIFTGSQSDAVTLTAVVTDGQTVIATTDFPLGSTNLDGADSVVIVNSTFDRLNPGLATYTFSDPNLAPTTYGLLIITGNGNDAVSIANVHVTEATVVETGNGTDHVAISALTLTPTHDYGDFLYALLGSGNYDTLTVVNSSGSSAVFEGGGNTGDTLVKAHNNFQSLGETDTGFQYVIG
jgi:large repetitive protein